MKRVCLLLSNGFEAFEASVFTDVIGWNNYEGDGTTELVTVGVRDRLKCTWSFTVIPELLTKDLKVDDFDALAIPGGAGEAGFYEDAYSDTFIDIIRQFDEQNKIIASICVGSLPIGKSGVLTGRKGTSYNLSGGKRQKELAQFGVNVVEDQSIVIDGNIITSHNPASATEVAFTLLEMLTSKDNADLIKKQMGFL